MKRLEMHYFSARCGACIDYIERGVYPDTDVRIDLLTVSTTKDTKTAK
jgi:hypothetical protein